MNPMYLLAAGTMIAVAATGAALVHLVRPAPPDLQATLAQLDGTRTATGDAAGSGSAAPAWIPGPVMAWAGQHLGAAAQDLAILSIDRDQLAARRVTGLVLGAVAVPLAAATASLAGIGVPVELPAAVTVFAAWVGWRMPADKVTARASTARDQFNQALTTYTGLVALERVSRGSPVEALEEAARVSSCWPFVLLHQEIARAELTGQQPWDALGRLGARIGSDPLSSMARVVDSAATNGAAIFDTLLAESAAMRAHALAEAQREAGAASERMVIPVTLCVFAFALLFALPALAGLV
ncbi:type II secretion system F family protein [Leekyejoonella antrihumi]|uniref:Type II secretion system protein GspF domain-containing protein n=1 Tax=Leekyejoonella antrihumi TaxID=1660198 RepID=A0A563DWF9_9MICO|nr:type II secretion system F family protein [Leekyejoonella antrihumi]TWP34459.1 hypothetical protein FGL98_17230 [Leekyejoonella antrihumi]